MPAKKKSSEEFERFNKAMDTILSVPKSEIARREQEYREQAALKPRRGPKPRRKP